MSDVKELADQVISAVKSYIAQSVLGLSTRLDEFDGRLKSVPSGIIERLEDHEAIQVALKTALESLPSAILAEIPKPKDGEPGSAGKDSDPQQVAQIVIKGLTEDPVIRDQIIKAVQEQYQKTPAKDGQDGRNAFEVAVSLGFQGDVYAWQESLRGEKGHDGASVTPEQVIPELKAELDKAISALPVPTNGKDGADSKVTAEDFRALFETESTKALLDFERRAQDVLLKAIANIPAPKDGKDGADGLGFDDLKVIHDGERHITLKFVRGDVVKEFPLIVPALIDRGVYKAGQDYQRGDCVSFGGSIWIAQKDTSAKPETDDTWRLSVKRGRDGKDGERGPVGEKGIAGKNGRDLTQMLHDGTKF